MSFYQVPNVITDNIVFISPHSKSCIRKFVSIYPYPSPDICIRCAPLLIIKFEGATGRKSTNITITTSTQSRGFPKQDRTMGQAHKRMISYQLL